MTSDTTMRSGEHGALASSGSPAPRAGTPVAVRTRFDGSWAGGFEIVDATHARAGELTVLRCSDNWVLPTPFAAEEVRITLPAAAPSPAAPRPR